MVPIGTTHILWIASNRRFCDGYLVEFSKTPSGRTNTGISSFPYVVGCCASVISLNSSISRTLRKTEDVVVLDLKPLDHLPRQKRATLCVGVRRLQPVVTVDRSEERFGESLPRNELVVCSQNPNVFVNSRDMGHRTLFSGEGDRLGWRNEMTPFSRTRPPC